MSNSDLQIRAAVVREANAPFSIEEMSLAPPRANEVLIRIVSAGVCHTDAVVRAGVMPTPLPAVLGHEGAGIVEKVGSKVTKVQPGDHVVLTFHSCGECSQCIRAQPATCRNSVSLNFSGQRSDGSHALVSADGPVADRFFGQSSFATRAIANERNTVKVRKDAPLEQLASLGCGVQTGAGAVINSLKVQAGESIAVIGTGAVGLSAVMAAKLVGAAPIIVVDRIDARLELAKALGATAAIRNDGNGLATSLHSVMPDGLDYIVDTTGAPAVLEQATQALGPRGICCMLGTPKPGASITINLLDFLAGTKTFKAVIEGDSNPDEFIPFLVDRFVEGKFPLDRLNCFYSFSDIEKAFADAASGVVIKPILIVEDIGQQATDLGRD